MAIVVCPECKKEISSKADHCVHCGCNFIVCPECETVYIDKIDVCRECGFVLKDFDNKNKSDINIKCETNLKEVSNEWESQRSSKFFTRPLCGLILFLAAIAMIVVAIVTLVVWSNKDGATMITEYENTFSNSKFYFALFGVFYVLLSIHNNLGTMISQSSFKKWLSFQKIDLNRLIKDSFNFDKSNMAIYESAEYFSTIEFAIQTSVYSEDIILKSKQRIQGIIKVGFSFVFAILMVWFFISNAEVYTKAELWKNDMLGIGGFEFSMIENWWLVICAVVVFIIGSIYSGKTEKQKKIDQDAWVKKNLPDCFSLYEKHIKNGEDDLLADLDKAEK